MGPCCRWFKIIYPSGFLPEFKCFLLMGWPLIVTTLCQAGMQVVPVVFAGTIGKTELAAVALSNTIININGIAIANGLCTACSTVFSQCYGSKNRGDLGLHLQRSLCIISLACLPCCAINVNIETLLLLLNQDPLVAKLCGEYLLIFMPGLLMIFTYNVLMRFVQCQSRVTGQMIVGLLGVGIHISAQFLFVKHLNLGITGGAIGHSLTYCSLVLLTVLHIWISRIYKTTWTGWDRRCLLHWKPFTKLALYGTIMLCLEWWALEAGSIVSGMLGTTILAANALLFNLDFIAFSIAHGIGVTVAIRVGQKLGRCQPLEAKTTSRVGMTSVIFTSTIICVLFTTLRKVMPKLFTSDKDVIELASNILPLVSVYVFLDSISVVGRGVVRGAGKQRLGSILSFMAFYIIALPLGITLMFKTSLSLKGLWIGYTVALSFLGVIYFVYLEGLVDWNQFVAKAQCRLNVFVVALQDLPENISKEGKPNDEESSVTERASISTIEVSPVVGREQSVTSSVICQRLLVLGTLLTILAGSVACKIWVHHPREYVGVYNNTQI